MVELFTAAIALPIHLFSITHVVSLVYMQHLSYSLQLHTPPMGHRAQPFLLLISAAIAAASTTTLTFLHLFSVSHVISLIYMQRLFYSRLLHTPPTDHLA